MALATPFIYQLFMAEDSKFLPSLLFDLVQHGHKKVGNDIKHPSHESSVTSSGTCSHVNDLWSLYYPVSDRTNSDCKSGTCGGYLSPLTHSAGATYAPDHASAYLSWILYLADDLYEQLDRLKMSFEELKCSQCGSQCTNTIPNCHTSSTRCSCPSVVQCSGVLPLLYANGLNFTSATSLTGSKYNNGRWTQEGANKRSCQQFYDQLTAVLAQDENTPLFKLLTTIDDFLFMFRFYFFYNLSSF
ncbi:extracellular matrix-binding ebh, putative [Babesia caballi]|uniref:Extracellular matrix-binding ebh, putative n=1 Tax=Babesia caballi TaxID=5871 RepID=A0AAV4LLZ1_BABCB|nr:extracellular matrix-binding ebh, putative [Babesia caballi]